MAAVYARFDDGRGWKYKKVGKGRPPKDAKFHIRFTDAQGKRRWSQPYSTPQEAQENAAGVKVATQAAAQGLTWDMSPGEEGERWGARLETYLTDPSEEPDMSKWVTELAFRLADQ